MRRTIQFLPLGVLLLLALAAPPGARAQGSTVSASDIQRLERDIDQAADAVSQLGAGDDELARRLQQDLDDLRDEVTYLRVKSRKEGVTHGELDDLRTRIDDVRRAAAAGGHPATGRSPSSYPEGAPASGGRAARPGDIPVGQEIDVRIQTPLSSGTAQVEDRFEATTLVDLYEGDAVLVPAGSIVRGVVSGVEKAGRLDRKGSLTLAFDQLTVRGVDHPIRATVTQAIESKGIRGEGARVGIGAAAGAILGGILGGAQGALAGIFIGSGGVLAAVPGKDVELPAGTVLRVRFDTPVNVGPPR